MCVGVDVTQGIGSVDEHLRRWLTNFSRTVFSLRAPMQPAKPSTNMTAPTTMNSHTGSKPPRSVMDDRLASTPWGGNRGCHGRITRIQK